MRKMLGQAQRARGTQSHQLHAISTSPLSFRPRLWLTFQPIPRQDRSVLIGVGLAATSVEITRERGPREACTSGSTCGISRCYGLAFWQALS